MVNVRSSILFVACLAGAPHVVAADAPQEVDGREHRPAARSLTLAEAYRLAEKNNPTLEIMEARIRRASAGRRRAWAAINPAARVHGTYTFSNPEVSFDPTAFLPPGEVADPIVIQKRHQMGFDLEAELPLFRGPAYHNIGIARKGVAAARLRLVRTRRDFMLRLANAYYRTLGLEEVVTALEEQVVVDRRNVDVVRMRFEAGSTLRSEFVRAELVLVQDQQSLVQQTNALQAASRRVAILVGLPGTINVTRPPEPRSPLTAEQGMMDAALRRRADLQALKVEIAAAKQAKTAAWWSFLPSLDLGFLYRWQEAAGFVGQKDNYALVGTLGFPLYEGGVRYADLRAAEASIAEGQSSRDELARDIAENIAELRAELLSAEAGLIAADKAIKLADITAEEMAARYEAGTATQLDLLDANQRRLEARIDLTRSRYSRDMARLALARSMGKDIERGE